MCRKARIRADWGWTFTENISALKNAVYRCERLKVVSEDLRMLRKRKDSLERIYG